LLVNFNQLKFFLVVSLRC